MTWPVNFPYFSRLIQSAGTGDVAYFSVELIPVGLFLMPSMDYADTVSRREGDLIMKLTPKAWRQKDKSPIDGTYLVRLGPDERNQEGDVVVQIYDKFWSCEACGPSVAVIADKSLVCPHISAIQAQEG
jgi:hypothetical protein